MIMNGYLQNHAVILTVAVLYFTLFSSSNGRNLELSQLNNGSSSTRENGQQSKSRIEDTVGVAAAKGVNNSQQSRQQRTLQSNPDEDAPVWHLSSTTGRPPLPVLLVKDPPQVTEATESLNNDKLGSKVLAKDEDTLEVSSSRPSTYRPARPVVTPTNIAQERERKLMNVLAARRTALQNDRFRTRIGATGRTTTMTSVETTSRAPTDARSICIRNCTKNFTRRTTASCMRQCSNFSRSSLPSSKVTTAPSGGTVIVRSSSRTGSETQAADRDNNEILFTDESSHGLFVVAKEQNDTLNHIPDVTKTEKFRPRNKLSSIATIPPTSIEDEDIQPYLYFGQKLPPIKPATLTITSVSEEHPKLLEVSVSQLSSTTPTNMVSASTLSAVERSRSRYKYRDRGYISVRRSPSRVGALTSINLTEAKRGSLVSDVAASQKNDTKEENVMEKNVVQTSQRSSTQVPLLETTDSTIPLIIKVYADEEESSQLIQFNDESAKENITYPKSIANLTNIPGKTSTSATPLGGETISQLTPLELTSQRTNVTSLRPFITTTTATIFKAKTATMRPIVNITTSSPKFLSASTPRYKTIIHEDIEKLRALGPNLTRVIINDKSLIVYPHHTTSSETPSFDTVTKTKDVDATSIFHTTMMTSVRSTVKLHTENPLSEAESTSTESNKESGLSYVGIIETTPFEKLTRNNPPTTSATDIKSTYVAKTNDVSQEMRRVNIATMVLAGIGIIPLCALVLYLVRSYLLRRKGKHEEDFDVCITDQQPISPVKKLDSKYRIKREQEDESNQHTVYSSQHQPTHSMSMTNNKTTTRETNNNNRYDERCSITSDQEFDRDNIRLKSLLGEGNFGQVWKAEADDLSGHFGATRIVAVKTIRKCSPQCGLKEEADIMRKLGSHQNVVTLLGACVETEPHMLIMEYAMRGRLLSLLRAARSATNILPASVPGGRSLTPLSPRTLGGFACDIACGMEYIAEKRIVHRDLAARNVLLDHNGVCKICDFGMSIDIDGERKRKETENNNKNEIIQNNTKKNKFDLGSRFIINHWNNNFHSSNCSPNLGRDCNEKKSNIHGHANGNDTISRRPALPIRWMAPEALQYHIFTSETDVWAFGIVLWEIATLGATPYSNLTGREVIRRVPNGLRPEVPKEGRLDFYNLMTRCWNKDPNLRPSFTYARQEISRTMHKWADDDSAASDYMDVSGFSEDLEQGIVYFNHRISEFECEI